MKVLHIGWILPAVFILTGCLSSTAYGEGRRPAGDQVPSTADEASSEVSYETEASAESSEPAAETSEPIRVPQHISYAGRDYLYLSNDAGATWRQLDIKPEISDATYITASAIHPGDPDFLVVGTSYYGLFASRDGGQSWTDLDPQSALRPIYQGLGFYNEISGLLFSPDGESLYIRTGFGGGTFSFDLSNRSLESYDPAILDAESAYESLPGYAEYYRSVIEGTDIWPDGFPHPPSAVEDNVLPGEFTRDEAWARRRELASGKYGFYINAWQASNRLDYYVNYAREMGFNSVVVDFKDDQGLLRYNSELPVAIDADTIRPLFDARELISKFHEAGIYVIGRLVVFKDKGLYAYDNNRYALWDERLDQPWGVYRQRTPEATEENPEPEPYWEQVEFWVDPYSRFVRDYNIAIAREMESLGVDEIQFDYIRFPSDGRPQDIVTRFLMDENGQRAHVDVNSQRVRILATFLSEARENIGIPIGTDVFGFNAWSRMSYLGQDIEMISHYVDVISPMSYPSHYPRDFYRELSYLDRARLIYEEGTRRTRAITEDRVLVRQYVQAFLIGSFELSFEQPVYFDYLNRQLEASIDGGGSGFTLWNNSGRYYMVDPVRVPEIIRESEARRTGE
jgi:hypothetical protein